MGHTPTLLSQTIHNTHTLALRMLRTTITQTTRTIARATVAVGPAERTFVTTTMTQKSATETIKESADKVRPFNLMK